MGCTTHHAPCTPFKYTRDAVAQCAMGKPLSIATDLLPRGKSRERQKPLSQSAYDKIVDGHPAAVMAAQPESDLACSERILIHVVMDDLSIHLDAD